VHSTLIGHEAQTRRTVFIGMPSTSSSYTVLKNMSVSMPLHAA